MSAPRCVVRHGLLQLRCDLMAGHPGSHEACGADLLLPDVTVWWYR